MTNQNKIKIGIAMIYFGTVLFIWGFYKLFDFYDTMVLLGIGMYLEMRKLVSFIYDREVIDNGN